MCHLKLTKNDDCVEIMMSACIQLHVEIIVVNKNVIQCKCCLLNRKLKTTQNRMKKIIATMLTHSYNSNEHLHLHTPTHTHTHTYTPTHTHLHTHTPAHTHTHTHTHIMTTWTAIPYNSLWRKLNISAQLIAMLILNVSFLIQTRRQDLLFYYNNKDIL